MDEAENDEMPELSTEEDQMDEPEELPGLEETLRVLPMFDDFFLGMQAMNLALIDQFLQEQETVLLRELIELEGTPPATIFVSALSQLWIFGLYELLRTWRQRVEDILRFVEQTNALPPPKRKQRIIEKRVKLKKLAQHALESPWKNYAKALRSPGFVHKLEKAYDQSEFAFRRIEALRMSLAKHEVPKSGGVLAMMPGYGRIDELTGSIAWQIVLEGNEVDSVTRRDLAKACRTMSIDRSPTILPRTLQKKLVAFPKHTYATKKISVTLKSKDTFSGVIVAWNKEVVFVAGHPQKMPFDAREVVDAKPDIGS